MQCAVLAFVLGVLLLQMQPVLPAPTVFLAVGALLCLPRLRWQGWAARGLALLGVCALGFGWAAWRAELRLADALAPALEGRDIVLTGVVSGLPQDFDRGVRFVFVVDESAERPAGVPRRVQLAWYDEEGMRHRLWPGEHRQFTVRLKRPHGGANPGGFDYELWLLERGIRATGYVRRDPPPRLLGAGRPPAGTIDRLRAAVRARFEAQLPAATYPWQGILTALAVGDQKAVDGDLWEIFKRTGVAHLMAISGLHISLVAGLCGLLAATLWRRRPACLLRLPAQRVALLAAGGGALAYALLAGFGIPAQRATGMLLVAILAMFSGRVPAVSGVLSLALLAVVAADPWAVLAPGFWLSFGIVAALLLVAAGNGGAERDWRARLRGWGSVQWAATLASLPVLLAVFGQFPLLSPLANLVAIPLVGLCVTPLALLAVIVPWAPLLQLAHLLLDPLMRFLIWCAQWPAWQVPAVHPAAALLAVAGVGLLLLPRGMPGRWLGALLLLPALFPARALIPAGEARIDVLDVGQGLAAVVRTRNHALVYDTGPAYGSGADAGGRVLVPYLRWLGVGRIDRLLVSHGDADHAGGVASLTAALPIADALSSDPSLGWPCEAGQHWQWDGVTFTLLHPLAGLPSGRRNERSCVLSLAAGGQRMLLTGDIGAREEAALLRRDAAVLRADVLLAPHHGAKGSSTAPFIAAVNAPEVLFSVGHRNRFGHPRTDVLERHAARGSRIWRTDRDGALQVVLGREGATVQGWRQVERRYWAGR